MTMLKDEKDDGSKEGKTKNKQESYCYLLTQSPMTRNELDGGVGDAGDTDGILRSYLNPLLLIGMVAIFLDVIGLALHSASEGIACAMTTCATAGSIVAVVRRTVAKCNAAWVSKKAGVHGA